MKKYILLILVIGFGFSACNNPNEKEIAEIDALLTIVNDTEKSLLSVDTSRVFAAKMEMEKDLAVFNKFTDTLNKEEAFKVADIFGNKKKLYRLTSNYSDFIRQINFSRDQLTNLKKDLENGLIKKEDFSGYYKTEETSLMNLNSRINQSINGIETVIGKFELDRQDLLKIIEQKKLKAAANE